MKDEHSINLGVTVKVEFGDTTIDLMNRLLNLLEDKVINNSEKRNKTEKIREEEAKGEEIILEQINSEYVELNRVNAEKIVETEVSLEQLRAELSEVREKGGKELIKELLEYVGANKLSDVRKEDYGKLMKKIKEVK